MKNITTQNPVFSGNVGIGTTNPDSPLTVVEAGNVAFKMLKSNYGNLFTIGEDGGSSAILSANLSGGGLIFKTTDSISNNEAMRILSNGNVGIGTTNPGEKLEVAGTIKFGDGHTIGNGDGDNLHIISSAGENIIYQASGGINAFWGASEHMRIDSSGNVGIGTTNPGAKLQISGGGAGVWLRTNNITNRQSNTMAGQNYINLTNQLPTDENSFEIGPGYINLNRDDNTPINQLSIAMNGALAAALEVGGDFVSSSYNNNYSLRFKVGVDTENNKAGIERMRIASNGYVGIGTTNPGSALHVSVDHANNYAAKIDNTATSGANGLLIRHTNNAADSNSAYFLHCQDSAEIRLRIFSDGDVQNHDGAFGQLSSDLRLKENIVDAPGKLEDLMSLEVKNYNFIGEDKKMIGFVAQDFEKVFPSLVTISDTREYDDDGNVTSGFEDARGMKVGMEFAILTKAIQEQQQIIEDLKSQNESLAARITTLEG